MAQLTETWTLTKNNKKHCEGLKERLEEVFLCKVKKVMNGE